MVSLSLVRELNDGLWELTVWLGEEGAGFCGAKVVDGADVFFGHACRLRGIATRCASTAIKHVVMERQ